MHFSQQQYQPMTTESPTLDFNSGSTSGFPGNLRHLEKTLACLEELGQEN